MTLKIEYSIIVKKKKKLNHLVNKNIFNVIENIIMLVINLNSIL
jgi:hypothetical protein